jgi:Pentapeptide repeats (8 copies)
VRMLLWLSLAGCTQHVDPCAGVVGPCVGVHLDSEVRPINQVRITLDGSANRLTPATPANLSFPVRFAVTLPESSTRAHLDFSGLQVPREVAVASADVTLGAGGHAEVSATLRAPGPPDLAMSDLTGVDFSGADLTELPDLTEGDLAGADLTELPDLMPPPDLAVVYPITVKVGGTGGGTVAVDGANCLTPPCTYNKLPGAAVTITAVAAAGSTLVATTGSCFSTSTTCTFNINGPSATTSNFKSTTLSMLRVVKVPISVSVATLGVAVTTPTPTASCGADCYLFPTSTTVSLAWTVVSGQFLGWGGVNPACRSSLTCDVKVDNDMGVTASYSDSVPNYVFVSSTNYTTAQINAAGTPQATADNLCRTLAMGAGYTDYASFKAWLSSGGITAPSRGGGGPRGGGGGGGGRGAPAAGCVPTGCPLPTTSPRRSAPARPTTR